MEQNLRSGNKADNLWAKTSWAVKKILYEVSSPPEPTTKNTCYYHDTCLQSKKNTGCGT